MHVHKRVSNRCAHCPLSNTRHPERFSNNSATISKQTNKQTNPIGLKKTAESPSSCLCQQLFLTRCAEEHSHWFERLIKDKHNCQITEEKSARSRCSLLLYFKFFLDFLRICSRSEDDRVPQKTPLLRFWGLGELSPPEREDQHPGNETASALGFRWSDNRKR